MTLVVASAPHVPPDGRSGTELRSVAKLSQVLVWTAAVTLAIGFGQGAPWIVSLGTLLVALSVASRDFARSRTGGITPITTYALSIALGSLANTLALLSADSLRRQEFFLYAVDEHLMLATTLWLAGGIVPVLGFWAFERLQGTGTLWKSLPRVSGVLAGRRLVVGLTTLALLTILVNSTVGLPALGTLSAIILLIPQLAIFVLARLGTANRTRGATAAAFVLAALEASRGLLLEFLRIHIVAPFIAFALGALVGSRSLKPLRSKWFIALYAVAVVFVVWFGALGEARSTGGLARLSELNEWIEEDYRPLVGRSFLSRLTSFNQLTQVARVVEEDGFYDGATLEYLGFAFVPRFLWPDKPLIAKGAWFAMRTGLARHLPDGRISNSVNMTIPGELYLNFGWLGVVIGCLCYGALLALLWSRTSFWGDSRDVLGGAFGFYLLWTGLVNSPDLQVIVTLIAIYLLFAAASLWMQGSLRWARRSESSLELGTIDDVRGRWG